MEQGTLKDAALQKWKHAQQVEKKLETELKNKDKLPRFQDVDNLIVELRTACESTLFLDFEYATRQDVEPRLWASHSLMKDRYKRLVGHYRENEPSRHVERRKLEQRYVNFIKTTQFYYKGYIQRLASHFHGMRELRRIADRLSLNTQTVDEREHVTPHVKGLIEKSCHATLLRLGDLSRYRNELRTKNRTWAPALGYYTLASDLCPHSGSSHNQMAVIALADMNHLDAVYHLYRAIAVEQPHPLAEGNLEIEFKKVTTAWEKKSVSHTSGNNEATLILWFVRLHARFYSGVKFTGHDELENEVLSRVARLLKEQAFEETLFKLIVVNIAAEYFAGERIKKENSDVKETSIESFYFFLRFNVRFLCVLLQTIQPELEVEDNGDDLPGECGVPQSGRAPERITAITRRVLPAIRQYSLWLVSRALIIIATVNNQSIASHIHDMWRMYASVLTKLIQAFPVEELPVVKYLFEEDETTVGFMPFRDPSLPSECSFYTGDDGQPKSRSTDRGVDRNHPNVEMKGRIRDILLCALVMRQKQNFPIDLNTDTLEFTFAKDSPQLTGSSSVDATPSPPTNSRRAKRPYKAPGAIPDTNQDIMPKRTHKAPEVIPDTNQNIMRANSVTPSDSHQSMDTDMHRMVDSLLEPSTGGRPGSNETSYGMHTGTANENFVPISDNGYQRCHINTQSVLPSLPSIWNSPFTPQPNELATHSPNHENTGRRNISPLQLGNSGQQDGMTSYKDTPGSGWGTTSSDPANASTTHTVNRVLQESLAKQFMPMSISASAFSNSSSIYANTPRGQRVPLDGTRSNTGFVSSNVNNTMSYTGASDFDRNMMLRSSIWDNSQSSWAGGHAQTPPGGQRG